MCKSSPVYIIVSPFLVNSPKQVHKDESDLLKTEVHDRWTVSYILFLCQYKKFGMLLSGNILLLTHVYWHDLYLTTNNFLLLQAPFEVQKRLEEVRLLESRKSARLADQDTDFARLADMAGDRKRTASHTIDVPAPSYHYGYDIY